MDEKAGGKVCKDCETFKPLSEFQLYECKTRRHRNYGTYCKPWHKKRSEQACHEKHGGKKYAHLTKRYGVTKVDWERMFEEQGGKCAICQIRPAYAVDHCHKTKKVRGILCNGCNRTLGGWRDDPKIALRAARYLLQGEVNGTV